MKKDLTEFNAGGTHAQNPNGGIPQGMGPNGKVNTVEEGETKFKINGVDYVFSNRLNLKDAYINDFYLPNYIKGKSFAEASKVIEERFKDRMDNASVSTKEAMYKRLSEAQQTEKLEQEASDAGMSVDKYLEFQAQQMAAQQAEEPVQQQQPEASPEVDVNGDMMRPENEFKKGGFLGIFNDKGERQAARADRQARRADRREARAEDSGSGPGVGGVISGGLGIVANNFDNLNTEGKQDIAGAAIKGAMAGAPLGPIGIAGSAALSIVTASIANKKAHNREMDAAVAANNDLQLTENGRAYGGYMHPSNEKHEGGFIHRIFGKHPHPTTEDGEFGGFGGNEGFGGGSFGGGGAGGDWAPEYAKSLNANREGLHIISTDPGKIRPWVPGTEFLPEMEMETPEGLPFEPPSEFSIDEIEEIHEEEDFADDSHIVNPPEDGKGDKESNWMTYAGIGASLAPFIGNIAEGANLSAPDKNHLARVGRTYIPEFADEKSLQNVVDDSYAGLDESLANAANGNIGAYRTNIIGAAANKAKDRMAAYNQINEINRQERKNLNADFAAAAKENVDKYNIEQDLDKQDRAAYDAAKQSYRIAAYEGLGELGKTIFTLNQADGLTSYDFLTGKKKKGE